MSIDLKNLNPSTRFNYDEDVEEWVELRLVSGDKMEEFRKAIGMKPKTKYRKYHFQKDGVCLRP